MKRKTKLTVLALLIMLMIIIGTSYSFFAANISYVNKTNTKLISNTLGLNFKGKTEVINCSNIVPGDKCIKTFDVENTSNTATYYNIYMEDVSNGFDSDLVYTLKEGNTEVISETAAPTTSQGKTYILANVEIPASPGKHQYTLTLEFKYKANEAQNTNQGKQFSATVGIDAVQGAEVATGPKCKRATTLHTDGIHTYGNLGTSGQDPVSGDAFDCDVNGNGQYTERFYYVTDLDTNTAVLISSDSLTGGTTKDNVSGYAYASSGESLLGPITAINQLPTIEDWPNIQLTNVTRSIKDETGNVVYANFEYKVNNVDLAARLLTTQEVESACNITVGSFTKQELDPCAFLMENTYYQDTTYRYGYWLENPRSSYNNRAWNVYGGNPYNTYRNVDSDLVDVSTYLSVRPAIEVAKTDIEY